MDLQTKQVVARTDYLVGHNKVFAYLYFCIENFSSTFINIDPISSRCN